MCGIAGIVGANAQNMERGLDRMSTLLAHRGPDDAGRYLDKFVGLAHRRLSILDLSPQGHNPMFSTDGRYVITYNGEVYNYLELRDQIGSRYEFRSKTDTEVILAAYHLWGVDAVSKLVGMFAFAIWDRKEQQLFCARDRLGIKPFYYRVENEHFFFASEIKSLLPSRAERRANSRVIADYLRHGIYDRGPETFFEGVMRLEPGCLLFWRLGALKISRYWTLSGQIESTPKSDAQLASEVRGVLEDSVEIALRSDVPIGVNLSGGLDSSTLLQLLNRFLPGTYPLWGFTQDYREPSISERNGVEENARFSGRPVEFSYLTPEQFIQCQEALLWFEDEPHGGVPVAGYVGVYQSAVRHGVKVLLDGNGLDESLAGYRQYHALHLLDLQDGDSVTLPRKIEEFCQEWSCSREELNRLLISLRSRESVGKDGVNQWQAGWVSPELISTSQDAWEGPYSSRLKNQMAEDLLRSKIPRALRFNDRISMAFSKELRVPFLDHRLIELCMSIPDERLFSNGRPKGLLRTGMEGILPEKIRCRPKHHAQSPQSIWFSGSLRGYAQEILESRSFAERGYFQAAQVRRDFASWEGRTLSNSFALWQAIHLESWFRMFIDGEVDGEASLKFPEVLSEVYRPC